VDAFLAASASLFTVQAIYDIGLYDISSIESAILRQQFLTVNHNNTLLGYNNQQQSFITTQNIQYFTIYSRRS